MDLPWGAFGAFLLERVRPWFSSSCPGPAAIVDQIVDQKDERKPVVLVICDQKLPLEKGSSFLLRLPWRAVASREGGCLSFAALK
jgi:hypothetical protein